ncbi:MAG: leucine-rich repeat protein [Ruminococcus sp.]|nr:leucine-rich repeat protein [Ruminococcus sp.]
MKFSKIITSLLIMAELNPLFSHAVESGNITFNGLDFMRRGNSSNELILTDYTGTDETLVIPENIGEYTVTAIDDSVFQDNQNIKNVILPDSINYFGSGVFRDSSLVSVNIPHNLRLIPSYSFGNCSALETVLFNDNIALIDKTAFKGTDIELPPELQNKISDYITNSDSYGFFDVDGWHGRISSEDGNIEAYIYSYDNYNTEEIIVPDNINGITVTGIEDTTFPSKIKKSVKKIYFPDTITKMDIDFKNSVLEEITLPDVNSINDSQFYGCKNLKKVSINGDSKHFTIGEKAFMNCVSLDSIPYPDTCTDLNIGKSAFQNTSFEEIRIDINSEINENAFRKCNNLSYAELNNAHVMPRAFRDCPLFEDVTITGNSVLEELSFYDCDALKNITLSDLNISMTNAVYNCRAFATINNQNAFDDTTGDFNKNLREFIFRNFSGSDDVGFLNKYIMTNAERIVSEITNENMTEVQKIRAIHDWICENTVYDDGLSGDRKNHNDASVLMNDSTVCEGYARIANILYNTAGIESYYVNSKIHAWNIVKAGNNYFHVDTTWDDGEKTSHDWFMKSDREMKESGDSHEEWTEFIPSSLHNFQQGKNLPECTYSIGDVNQDNEISIADMVILKKYIMCQDSIDYDGYILCDLTSDGVVDSFDLVKMRQILT